MSTTAAGRAYLAAMKAPVDVYDVATYLAISPMRLAERVRGLFSSFCSCGDRTSAKTGEVTERTSDL